MSKKPYTAKSIAGAQRRVRELEKHIVNLDSIIGYWIDREKNCANLCKILARLAARGPAFFNPLEAMAAENVRDGILREMGMNPDGTFIETAESQRSAIGGAA